jgi:hypothetical protein
VFEIGRKLLGKGRWLRTKNEGSDQQDAFIRRDEISVDKVGEAMEWPSRSRGYKPPPSTEKLTRILKPPILIN